MEKKIVLVGAGSTSFGPAMYSDLLQCDLLEGSTIFLHDINKERLELIYELIVAGNEKLFENKFTIERSTDRAVAFKNADFIVSSIEVGERYKLWRQDYEIPRKHGSTQILGECGGPGGSFHAFRIIPSVIDIVKDAEKICPNAFFINFSNPMSRVCLAIKRAAPKLKFVGLCHQIGAMHKHLPRMIDESLSEKSVKLISYNEKIARWKKSLENIRMKVAGLNHFGFLLGLEDLTTGKDLMPVFNAKCLDYFKNKRDRFEFDDLTFTVYKKFGYFPYTGDNHLGEYLQIGEEFTKTQDMIDWINQCDVGGRSIYKLVTRTHTRLQKNKVPRRGILLSLSMGERAVPVIEEIIEDKKAYETAVNIPNDGLIENLPEDLVIECSAIVDKDGVHGLKYGNIPKNIAALLRIEASVQDVCVDAILNKSKELAITCLAVDPNVGSFAKAESMFDEMRELQKEYLSYLK